MKKNKKILFLFGIFAGVVLTSCEPISTNDEYIPSLITPTGAPTLPAYKLMISDKIDVTSPTDNTAIPAHLTKGDVDFVIFDATNAQKVLAKQGENAKYEFVQMLTGGNFHLLGFNKTEKDTPKNKDNILGFMPESTPGILFENIYGSDLTFDLSFNSIADLTPYLIQMNTNYEISGEVVDWAVVAEPANTQIQSKLKEKGITNFIDINLNAAFKEKHADKWNKDYICQAGLFVKKEFKEAHSDVFESTISLLNEGINKLFADLDGAFSEMTSGDLSNAETFTNTFGFNSAVIKGVQGNNSTKNGFGVVPTNVTFTVEDINLFNSLLA